MNKIVLLSSHPEPSYDLLETLNELFPDCEIQIVFREGEAFKQRGADWSSEQLMTDTIGRV